jgi:hypothetical protein
MSMPDPAAGPGVKPTGAPLPSDEFYIGYESGMPPGIRRRVRRGVAAAAIVVMSAVAAVTVAQRPLADSTFEYGSPQTFEGWLTWSPAPALLVQDGATWTRYWLVAQGKFGAARAVPDAANGWVRLDGTRVLREGWQMLEIVPGSVARISGTGAAPALAPEMIRTFHGRGEIVDSKCFLGVMNPGERIVHRDCAIRCLSGGIPAMFAYHDAAGGAHLALLLRADGQPVGRAWRQQAGSPIEIAGRLHVSGDLEVLVLEE